ncbi:von Willebrand factor, type A protein [Heracleum sosnowskyi]|uniref:von Willebrand factor, type A protein n=1 Tax=Heracleum sosnowskyi TaxID=360622 RepID=A0AAD8N6C7_9APIA|nr:von Willebrand factor, type A protein [Heracleum sosnowskyi]
MSSKWRKLKLALGFNLCVYVPPGATHDSPEKSLLSPTNWSFGSARLSKSFSTSSSKKTCSICLATMKRGDGNAIFTAECSHSFHFHCIASNVKHGNQICPVCRAKWKEIPCQGPTLELPSGRSRVDSAGWLHNNGMMTVVRRLPRRPNSNRHVTQILQSPEPVVFDDDESLDHITANAEEISTVKSHANMESCTTINVETYPEVSTVPQNNASNNFTVLIHLKAPVSFIGHSINQSNLSPISQTPRAPVDLVTILDISGSMAGTKLALLKRAMGFVIQNLGPNDRLTVIAFSSTARRLFPLCRMSETGRKQALQAVNSLVANGGTNIAEGLRKGAKAMEDRREKNPVASIILLSDGQDTYTINGSGGSQSEPNYQLLLPTSIHGKESHAFKIPVHAFGFGTDHDASLMHSISETSGGTFSFIETEGAIQDAFAQCIGGLLSVVVKELHLTIDSVDSRISLGSLKTGSYPNHVMPNGKTAFVEVGDLYADEERDFLVSVNVPKEILNRETSILKVRSNYINPLTKQTVTLESDILEIRRPEIAGQEIVSIEVDRQRNRLQAAESMAEARAAAEQGDLAGAISILESCRNMLSQTVSAKAQDHLCIALDAELNEMQERMASRHVYEASGRAYILSGLSSHSWQRATSRGDSIDSSSLVQSYQTRSMTEMLSRSQATLLGSPLAYRLLQPKPR